MVALLYFTFMWNLTLCDMNNKGWMVHVPDETLLFQNFRTLDGFNLPTKRENIGFLNHQLCHVSSLSRTLATHLQLLTFCQKLTFWSSIPNSVQLCSINMSYSTNESGSHNSLILSLAVNFP